MNQNSDDNKQLHQFPSQFLLEEVSFPDECN